MNHCLMLKLLHGCKIVKFLKSNVIAGLTVGYIIAQSLNEHTSHVNTIMEILHKYPKIVAFVDKFNILDVIQSAAFVTAIR